MRLSRRTALKAGAALGAAAGIPLAANRAAARPALLVHDSRLAESPAFLASRQGIRRFDMAQEAGSLWANVRRGLTSHGRIEGLTRWSDWVQLRGALEEQGFRMESEQRIPARIAGRNDLYRWTMRPR
ncbi:MAG: hypothetical protein H6918_01565 [Sphingomonadaceae bacterium]|nr:hypothetical protein [Sphingomonadaceae bacterium]